MEIKEIKQRLSITRVMSHYGLKPDKNKRINCLFHPDKTPSMQVYPETNTVYCFSENCKLHGKAIDQIDFIMHKEQLSKHEAILKAAGLINGGTNEVANGELKIENGEFSAKRNETKEEPPPHVMFSSFVQGFARSPKAKEYLKNRHLQAENLLVGFNSGKTYNQLKNCAIFPLKDKNGKIVSLYSRSIIASSSTDAINRVSTGKHYYTKNRSGLYPAYPNEETEILILTESVIDAATLLVVSDKSLVFSENASILACYGTNGLTEEHQEAIKGLVNLKEIIIFFDGDEAGIAAAQKYGQSLVVAPDERSMKISTVETPENEDINSLLDCHEPEILSHLIETRTNLFLSTEKKETKEKATEPEPGNNGTDAMHRVSSFNTKNPDYILFTASSLQFAVLGGINLNQLDRMRVTLKISKMENNIPMNTMRHNIDLYNDDQLEKFVAKASEKLETASTTISKAVNELIDKLETYRLSRIESRKEQKSKARELSPERKKRAVNYLKRNGLIKRTNEDIEKTGVCGEETNRMLMYLVFTSRLREQPLHIISLGASGTGKTYLQEKIAELIPETEKMEITILSENAFYYFEQKELRNKLVLIEDMDGAENVLYPLRELQSKKRISKTIPIKDAKGNLKTIALQVEGPISLAGTTTRERLYEDNANRSILIYLDNTKEQQEKIMDYQRRLSAGKIDRKTEDEVKELFKDIQSVLKQVAVRNPYAEQLKIPDYVFKPLRTNSHYLAFIETVTFYHQYQREIKKTANGTPYIATTIEDIEIANELIKDVLLAKSDELTKTVRSFFEGLKYHLKTEQSESFYAKELREKLRMNPMTVNRYLRELEQHGYIRRAGGNRKKDFEYEINNWTDYSDLQDNMKVLDEILEQIKSKQNGKNKESDKYNMSITSGDVILNESQPIEN